MKFGILASLVVAATAISAVPADLQARQFHPGPQCDGMGSGAFDIAYNFILGAYNRTLPNFGPAGAELTLADAFTPDGGEPSPHL